MTEAVILGRILEALGSRPDVTLFRINTLRAKVPGSGRMVRSAPDGTSDIIGILRGGRFLAIEVKSETGKVRPEQRTFLEAITAMGGLALVARSVDEAVAAVDAATAAAQARGTASVSGSASAVSAPACRVSGSPLFENVPPRSAR